MLQILSNAGDQRTFGFEISDSRLFLSGFIGKYFLVCLALGYSACVVQ